MTISVAVSGASGYAGGEVLRLLSNHPDVTIGAITAHSNAGQRLGELAPHLHSLADRVLVETTVEQLRGHDVVFLALPHGASAEIAAQLPADTLVIDAGADHRLESPEAWEKFYGSSHAGTWPYGLPELPGARELLVGAKRIAVPGCYPTSVQLALVPGFAANLLEPDDVVVVSASGTSGAGKSAKVNLIGSEVMGSMNPYGVGGSHRHTPEMEQGLSKAAGVPVTVSFTPTLAPMPRGILTTATARVKPGVDEATLRAAWTAAYQDEPFVHLLPEGQWPATSSVMGSNHAQIQLAFDPHANRVIVSAVIDNLTKGTAGGAVQSMNIALGLKETAGLALEGVAP
ncbi:N-acetyl-gamma-glutamyl-phosphate reductase [Paeniglutamicibacter sulfureus]|uniref:N-acetyl-gamma-glutamyl-phosphate reductase n=1 Tax=Paeniglutamicibacter sulfureus TaxID=43666 RepID=A0ABU2BEU4_9MICC|nr:N-acetyl-gamma-glutamyl-phosphate reductase [Paeniglutamicibacter sulfureus]MDO2932850.1 N-acetyl-gamma-glutamyl-phosphate reductase [Paeniglutamicibacter sulfureus]MDR7357123.1 N-acetyl-gamma-glutamyl-phosphate reductase [Paeniglutamicibacter sulfureus]